MVENLGFPCFAPLSWKILNDDLRKEKPRETTCTHIVPNLRLSKLEHLLLVCLFTLKTTHAGVHITRTVFLFTSCSLAVVGVANAHCLRWDVPMLDTEGFMSDQDPGLTLQPVWKTECGAPEHDFLCISEDRSRALVHG